MVPTHRRNHHVDILKSQPSAPKPRPKRQKVLPKTRRPGSSKSNRTLRNYTEETLQKALREIKNGDIKQKDTPKKYGIPYTTIVGRLNGRKQRSAAHAPQQVLTALQEEVLCSWIEFYANRGWVHRFLQRHKELAMRKPSGLDPKRAHSFNEEAVCKHFKELKEKLEMLGVPAENIL